MKRFILLDKKAYLKCTIFFRKSDTVISEEPNTFLNEKFTSRIGCFDLV